MGNDKETRELWIEIGETPASCHNRWETFFEQREEQDFNKHRFDYCSERSKHPRHIIVRLIYVYLYVAPF